jgi:hypothetical protein
MWKEAIMVSFKVLPTFTWRDCGKTMKEYERTVGVPAEIRTRNLLHTNQKHFHLSQLACFHLLVKRLF